MARRVLLINGPNLNLLGTREPGIYGSASLADVEESAQTQARELGIQLEAFQSNHEGAIIDRIQEAARTKRDGDGQKISAIVINPGAFTHTSIAIRDTLLGVNVPFVEVHVSNIHSREAWRHHSYFSDKAVAVICGLGVYGYTAAIEFVARHLRPKEVGKL